jgi:hypothetical protein
MGARNTEEFGRATDFTSLLSAVRIDPFGKHIIFRPHLKGSTWDLEKAECIYRETSKIRYLIQKKSIDLPFDFSMFVTPRFQGGKASTNDFAFWPESTNS